MQTFASLVRLWMRPSSANVAEKWSIWWPTTWRIFETAVHLRTWSPVIFGNSSPRMRRKNRTPGRA